MQIITVFCDGASRGNPGPAAIGAALLDETGAEIGAVSETIGVATNNEAEYRALVAGVRRAIELKPTASCRLEVRMDSELVVRQIEGRYKVKNERLKPLYEAARAALKEFGEWRIRHVPRAENSRPDELANAALDREKKSGR
jgi:ribonuclease HI/probable phosphoglycerate mutase